MDPLDRAVYALCAAPFAAFATYPIAYPLGLPEPLVLALFAVIWWALYRWSVKRWPEG